MPFPLFSSRLLPWRWLVLGSLALLLAGCSSLPRSEPFSVRPTVTSLGVEEVRIGTYAIDGGLAPSGIASLVASSLGAGSLPLQATLNLGLDLPGGLPPLAIDGFAWTLAIPGAEPVSGRYAQRVTLTPGDAAELRLPVSVDVLAGGQRLTDMARLANQLARRGNLPGGSELSITPGGVSSLGITLPSGLRIPSMHLSVDARGNLQTRY